jgi:hypothetical protein
VVALKTGANWRYIGESTANLFGARLLCGTIPDLKLNLHSHWIAAVTAAIKAKILSKSHGGAPPSAYYEIFSQAHNI